MVCRHTEGDLPPPCASDGKPCQGVQNQRHQKSSRFHARRGTAAMTEKRKAPRANPWGLLQQLPVILIVETARCEGILCHTPTERKEAPVSDNVLIFLLGWGILKPPNTERPRRRLCHAQRGKKYGFRFCQTAAARFCGRRSILAKQRPVSARTGGFSVAGERCFAFFYALKTPKHRRFPMIFNFHATRSQRTEVRHA